MKQWIWISLLAIALWGCKHTQKETPAQKNASCIQVLSTTAMIADIVAQVGGERVDSSVLILGQLDPHSYELVKGDDEKIDEAAIVFYNGLNLEHGASLHCKLLKHTHSVAVGDWIWQRRPDLFLVEKGQIDPHIWMDVSMWVRIVDPIVEALIQEDPAGRSFYEQRASFVKTRLLEFHQEFLKRMQSIPQEKRFLVTSHDAFGYFTRCYLSSEEERYDGTWRKRFAAPEGLAPDGQLSLLDLQQILDYVRTYQVHVVFPESNVSRDSLRKILSACRSHQTPIRFSKEVLYGDAMGPPHSLAGSYLGMIEHNGTLLYKEWQ
jgi:manganese/zinc/iron transport system substrate-binding protein